MDTYVCLTNNSTKEISYLAGDMTYFDAEGSVYLKMVLICIHSILTLKLKEICLLLVLKEVQIEEFTVIKKKRELIDSVSFVLDEIRYEK